MNEENRAPTYKNEAQNIETSSNFLFFFSSSSLPEMRDRTKFTCFRESMWRGTTLSPRCKRAPNPPASRPCDSGGEGRSRALRRSLVKPPNCSYQVVWSPGYSFTWIFTPCFCVYPNRGFTRRSKARGNVKKR